MIRLLSRKLRRWRYISLYRSAIREQRKSAIGGLLSESELQKHACSVLLRRGLGLSKVHWEPTLPLAELLGSKETAMNLLSLLKEQRITKKFCESLIFDPFLSETGTFLFASVPLTKRAEKLMHKHYPFRSQVRECEYNTLQLFNFSTVLVPHNPSAWIYLAKLKLANVAMDEDNRNHIQLGVDYCIDFLREARRQGTLNEDWFQTIASDLTEGLRSCPFLEENYVSEIERRLVDASGECGG